MGRAVIYTRVSTDKQEDGYSLEVQERDGRRYCDQQGLTVVAVESDTFSGHDSLYERDGIQQALKLIRSKAADTLVIWKVDRAGRFMVDNLLLLRDVSEAGGTFASVNEGVIPNTPTGKLLLSVHSFAGETEWEDIRLRTQAGLTARVAKGSILPGPVPLFGYIFEGDRKATYAIDDEAAPTVRLIFDKADQGWAARRIAKWLNEQGIPTASMLQLQRGQLAGRKLSEQWTARRVLELLQNESYTGQHSANRYEKVTIKVRQEDGRIVKKVNPKERAKTDEKRVALSIPALITVEQFERVQAALAGRQLEWDRETTEATPLLTRGIAFCGVCGARMVPVNREKWAVKRYMCGMRRDGCPGKGFAIKSDEVDADVWEKAKEIAQDDARFTRLVQGKSTKLAERRAEAVQRAATTARELDETRDHAKLVYDRMMRETDERIYARQREDLQQLEKTIAQLESRLADEQGEAETAQGRQDVHAALLAGISALLKRRDAWQGLTERYLAERGMDTAQAPALMSSLQDAAEEATLETLDREGKRGVLRLLSARVVMYPVSSEWAKANGVRWDFQFGVPGNGVTGWRSPHAPRSHRSRRRRSLSLRTVPRPPGG
jgi:site-specific DNA recombinase